MAQGNAGNFRELGIIRYESGGREFESLGSQQNKAFRANFPPAAREKLFWGAHLNVLRRVGEAFTSRVIAPQPVNGRSLDKSHMQEKLDD
jgi:hypothetical protein